MRRISLWIMATISAVVMLFGYRTSTSAALPADAAAATGGTTTASASTGTGSASSGTTPSASGGSGQTITGSTAQTRWGPVQVQLMVSNGTITAVDALQYPTENSKDQQINARAIPTLVKETLQAQSAHIDMVSGATYTSTGYVTSLQSALDQAGLA